MLIDCDAHLATPDCLNLVKDKTLKKRYLDSYTLKNNIKTVDQHRKEAEFLGITHQVINFFGNSTGMNYHLNKEDAADLMQVYNNFASTLVKESNGFFSATAWLAMQDIDASLAEIDKIKELGLFAIYLDDTIPWGRAEWAMPIFKKCNDLKIPIYLHFTKTDHYLNNQLSPVSYDNLVETVGGSRWPAQCKTSEIDPFLCMFYSLFESGILNKFENLKIIIAERGVDWIKPFTSFIKETLNIDALSLIKKHFWFTSEPEDEGFCKDVEYIGWDRILFASDHGHDNDCGGANFGLDLETIKKLNLTKQQYDNITFKNFHNLTKN